jgi:hypothetical protein
VGATGEEGADINLHDEKGASATTFLFAERAFLPWRRASTCRSAVALVPGDTKAMTSQEGKGSSHFQRSCMEWPSPVLVAVLQRVLSEAFARIRGSLDEDVLSR